MSEFAPFDKIIITAGVKKMQKALLSQLKIGEKMVVPVGDGIQKMISLQR